MELAPFIRAQAVHHTQRLSKVSVHHTQWLSRVFVLVMIVSLEQVDRLIDAWGDEGESLTELGAVSRYARTERRRAFICCMCPWYDEGL